MAISSVTYLKSKFETGDIPTEQDFIDFIDTSCNVIPQYGVFSVYDNYQYGSNSVVSWKFSNSMDTTWNNITESNTAFIVPANTSHVQVGYTINYELVALGGDRGNYGEATIEHEIYVNYPTLADPRCTKSHCFYPANIVADHDITFVSRPIQVNSGDVIELKVAPTFDDWTNTSNVVTFYPSSRNQFWIRRLG